MHKQVKDANDVVVSEAFHLRDASGRELGVQETEGAGENATSAWTWYAGASPGQRTGGAQRFAKTTPLQQPNPNGAQGGGLPFTYTNAYGSNSLKHVSYYIHDHLGNTRLTYRSGCEGANSTRSLTLEHVVDYYPYGSILREYREDRAERYLERAAALGVSERTFRLWRDKAPRILQIVARHPMLIKALIEDAQKPVSDPEIAS